MSGDNNNTDAQIAELNSKMNQLTSVIEQLLAAQKFEAEKNEKRLKEEAEANAKKLRAMGERLSASSGYSIHKENENIPTSIKDELPPKFVLGDLPIYEGHESPIVHIRALK